MHSTHEIGFQGFRKPLVVWFRLTFLGSDNRSAYVINYLL